MLANSTQLSTTSETLSYVDGPINEDLFTAVLMISEMMVVSTQPTALRSVFHMTLMMVVLTLCFLKQPTILMMLMAREVVVMLCREVVVILFREVVVIANVVRTWIRLGGDDADDVLMTSDDR